ncbi:MAG: beta-galactosidase trimerization domain-containing protein [Planctomycetota bacterium]
MIRILCQLLLIPLGAGMAPAGEDPFLDYCRSAPEFQPVATIPSRFDGFIYMPWRYQWTIGTDDEAGRFCLEHGIRGGFLDYGQGPIEWLTQHGLRFYSDHSAGKGVLHLRVPADRTALRKLQTDPLAVREPPLDDASLTRGMETLARNLSGIRSHPLRLAYALDDEISWGVLSQPTVWQPTKDPRDYQRWRREIRGLAGEARAVSPDDVRAELDRPLAEIDLSPLLDRMSYNDSVLAVFVGSLVREANRIDSETPCGIVGCRAPGLFGGYDYAKLMKQIQFAEIYDNGSAPEIGRSFGQGRGVPLVSTHFHREEPGADRWFAWSRFAHGERGLIGWVDGWFDGTRPLPWLASFGATLREICDRQAGKLKGAAWVHDRIALYYSHPSIQVGWCLDAEAHGRTWPARDRDHLLGTSHLVRKAWEHMLNDAGLQYDFFPYDELVRGGVPGEYDVLILPACFALSNIEAERLRAFTGRGGRLVADFMCGLFDERGRGRGRGVLDDLFEVRHDGRETRKDFFGNDLWVETDQDEEYGYREFSTLFETGGAALRDGFSVPETELETQDADPSAKYLNLSPQRYLLYREQGRATKRIREPFLRAVGVEPWIEFDGEADLEATRFLRGERTLLFVLKNPTVNGSGVARPGTGRAKVDIRFRTEVKDVINERTGEQLGDGRRFSLEFERSEALFLSLTTG